MQEIERIIGLIEAYRDLEGRMEEFGISEGTVTDIGIWTTMPLDQLIAATAYAVGNVFDEVGPLVVAGSGDGRESAMLSLYGMDPILSIEYDSRLVEASNQVFEALKEQCILNQRKFVHAVQGDFTECDPYNEGRIPFEQVKYFWTNDNMASLVKLATKIGAESPEGTKLILNGVFNLGVNDPNLPLELTTSYKNPDKSTGFLVYTK